MSVNEEQLFPWAGIIIPLAEMEEHCYILGAPDSGTNYQPLQSFIRLSRAKSRLYVVGSQQYCRHMLEDPVSLDGPCAKLSSRDVSDMLSGPNDATIPTET